MARKYLKGGSLNPAWCEEQDVELIREGIIGGITTALLNNLNFGLELELEEGINLSISNKQENQIPIEYNYIDTESDYEAKFNFLKRHSGTPEDLELAKQIIGII